MLSRPLRCSLFILLLAGCTSISPYSPKAYEQATSLKAEALITLSKASEPYAQHQPEAELLKLNIDKAYEYAKGLPKNRESTLQWLLIKDPERHSLGGFLKRWKDKSTLEKPFIEQAKDLIAADFDAVIELESGKQKP